MLEMIFRRVYTKFKMHFYSEIFERFENRNASLTIVETFCVETIQALGRPTVNEFATFMRISTPNAAYKVTRLVQKGYIRKVQSSTDRREFYLEVTQKYYDDYNISADFMDAVMARIRQRFPAEQCTQLEEMLKIIDNELMSDISLPKNWNVSQE